MKHQKLASRHAELLRQAEVIQKEINRLVSLEKKFFSEETPVLHRRHGWLNPDEREKIVRYFSAGITSRDIAEKFACSIPTVYRCANLSLAARNNLV